MKKTYITPTAKTYDIQVQAGMLVSLSSSTGNGSQLVKENDFDLFDDEDFEADDAFGEDF